MEVSHTLCSSNARTNRKASHLHYLCVPSHSSTRGLFIFQCLCPPNPGQRWRLLVPLGAPKVITPNTQAGGWGRQEVCSISLYTSHLAVSALPQTNCILNFMWLLLLCTLLLNPRQGILIPFLQDVSNGETA